MKRYFFIENPSPEQWRQLFTWALTRAHQVELAVADSNPKAPPKPLHPFENHIIDVFTTCYYWGNRQRKPKRFYRLALDESLRDFLLTSSLSANWALPSSEFEDIALYRDDIPILWTIAHHHMVFLWSEEGALAPWRAQNMRISPADDIAPPIVRKDVFCQRSSVVDKIMLLIVILIGLSFCGMAYYMIAALFTAIGG